MEEHNTRLLTGRPGNPLALAESLRVAYEQANATCLIRFGFAYVSSSGLDTVLPELDAVPKWQTTQKKWLIGLNRGITEPSALERIRALPNSSLKVFAGAEELSLTGLTTGKTFHGKVVGFSSGIESPIHPTCLLASSANLTGAALGSHARNFEAGLALFGEAIPRTQFNRFEDWWEHAWSESFDVNDKILDKYSGLRSTLLRRNRDFLSDLDPPPLSQLKDARTLWIEAGAMSGGSRNQVEFGRELAGFFGQPELMMRPLRIDANGKEWPDRPLAYKVTTFGVEIWRLSLPTESSGGFSYPGSIICFRKAIDSRGTFFKVNVALPKDRRAPRWLKEAHRKGYVGVTSGRRAFGFF
ncbi:MAG: hypothetical protein HC897_11915 [Thermoanaerobaculia bacterium]|nr:hypothetical protein [Thermoanaerobaculia bacterium]